MTKHDVLIELEHAGWRSLQDGSGSEFYGSLMSEDALMVLADGSVMTRDDVVASLDGAPRWDDYTIDDLRSVAIRDGVVALVYTGTGRRGDMTFVGVMTSVYVDEGERWRLALYQQTPSG
jgi:hypothetical protein